MNTTHKALLTLAAAGLAMTSALGQSNVSPTNKYCWGENLGWINWSDANSRLQGASVSARFLSGYIWSENAGWIDLGRPLFWTGPGQPVDNFSPAEFEPQTPNVNLGLPVNWVPVNNSPGGPGTAPYWAWRNDGAVFPAHSGAGYIYATFNSATGSNDISNYLMSPVVTLHNGDKISFWTRTRDFPLYAERLALEYNTTGTTLPASFTNTLVTVNPTLTLAGFPTVWTQFTGTISGLASPTIGRFALHYNPTNGGPNGANSDYIGVDDVQFEPAAGAMYGVNVDPITGNLSGYAWGENVGWINFGGGLQATPPQPARIEGTSLLNGRLRGFAWSENAGWLNLDVATAGEYVSFCYANCDGSTSPPILNVNDFQCFLNAFASGNLYTNCDASTSSPVLNVNDFQCFLNAYAMGCP